MKLESRNILKSCSIQNSIHIIQFNLRFSKNNLYRLEFWIMNYPEE